MDYEKYIELIAYITVIDEDKTADRNRSYR